MMYQDYTLHINHMTPRPIPSAADNGQLIWILLCWHTQEQPSKSGYCVTHFFAYYEMEIVTSGVTDSHACLMSNNIYMWGGIGKGTYSSFHGIWVMLIKAFHSFPTIEFQVNTHLFHKVMKDLNAGVISECMQFTINKRKFTDFYSKFKKSL